jgi:hypothetical protein
VWRLSASSGRHDCAFTRMTLDPPYDSSCAIAVEGSDDRIIE